MRAGLSEGREGKVVIFGVKFDAQRKMFGEKVWRVESGKAKTRVDWLKSQYR